MSDHAAGPVTRPSTRVWPSSRRWSATGGSTRIVVAFTDMQGRLMGKRVHGQAFLDGVISHGAHFCTYLLGTDMEMNTPEGYRADELGDRLRRLDRRADLGPAPLPALAARHGDGPRATPSTRRPARRSRSRLGRSSSARSRPPRTPGTSSRPAPSSSSTSSRIPEESLAEQGWPVPRAFGYYNEDYHLLQATKAEPLHHLLRTQMSAANVPIEFSKGEAANGQHEVNIRYDHVLESADRSVVFKHGAKEIAYLNGWGITFMAKPDHRWTGSSGHLHMSVWDRKRDVPLMHATGREKPGPYGLSQGRPAVHGRDDGAFP